MVIGMLNGTKITKRFGGLTALSEVDFEVRRGEIVGLIGPNGSGKTTLFNIISGLYKSDFGEISFKGQRISGLPPYKRCKVVSALGHDIEQHKRVVSWQHYYS